VSGPHEGGDVERDYLHSARQVSQNRNANPPPPGFSFFTELEKTLCDGRSRFWGRQSRPRTSLWWSDQTLVFSHFSPASGYTLPLSFTFWNSRASQSNLGLGAVLALVVYTTQLRLVVYSRQYCTRARRTIVSLRTWTVTVVTKEAVLVAC
jgi:hypothetical protein